MAADPQPLYRDALARTFRQDSAFQVVGEHADGRAALTAIRQLQPDVAVLEVDMPVLDGRRVVDAVARERMRTGVVLLASDVTPAQAFDAVAAGARGFLSKRSTGDQLRRAVRRAAGGDTVLCADAQSVLAGEIRLRHAGDRCRLGPREQQVVELIAQGLSVPEIARRLQIAPSTVKTHVEHLYERLGVSERAQAVAEAMRRGLLD